jgi:methylthioribulose-1-phosphate dehydratase
LESSTNISEKFAVQIQHLIETGRDFHHRGWSLGTSSNYSVVAERAPLQVLLTGSGFDKGRLTPAQFVLVDEQGKPVGKSGAKPSAETLLHVVLARAANAGAVLHTHSVAGTLLSEAHLPVGHLEISGYEMLKGLAGINTHETLLRVEIFPNTQDIPDLARRVEARLRDAAHPLRHAFLIAGHGLYTWGKDLAEARRHIEVLEFLFEIVARNKLIFPPSSP